MTRPTRADQPGRAPAGSRPAAAQRPTTHRRDDNRVVARRVDQRDPGVDQRGPDTAADQPLTASWDPQPESAAAHLGPERSGPGHARRGIGPFARAVSIYGWRVYALPLLIVFTVVALFDVAGAPTPLSDQSVFDFDGTPDAVREGAAAGDPLIPNPASGAGFETVKLSAELPGGGPFTVKGDQTWRVIPGTGAPFGKGRLFTYTVEVEDGVELEGGSRGFALTVDNTLNNPKSWIGSGVYQFQRIDDSQEADLRISLTSQLTSRALCGYGIPFDASCWKGDERRVVINTARWARGAVAFQGNVVQYQQYVVNHEVGHGLGFVHTSCAGTGRLAPIMMQQTWGVANDYLAALGTDRVKPDGQVCEPNAWPFPTVD